MQSGPPHQGSNQSPPRGGPPRGPGPRGGYHHRFDSRGPGRGDWRGGGGGRGGDFRGGYRPRGRGGNSWCQSIPQYLLSTYSFPVLFAFCSLLLFPGRFYVVSFVKVAKFPRDWIPALPFCDCFCFRHDVTRHFECRSPLAVWWRKYGGSWTNPVRLHTCRSAWCPASRWCAPVTLPALTRTCTWRTSRARPRPMACSTPGWAYVAARTSAPPAATILRTVLVTLVIFTWNCRFSISVTSNQLNRFDFSLFTPTGEAKRR